MPRRTPAEVVATLNRAFNEARQDNALAARLAQLGAEPAGGTPEELGAFMRQEAALWAKVVTDAKVRLE